MGLYDLILAAVENHIIPHMPPCALRDEMHSILYSRRWDEAWIYRGFRVRQKRGRALVSYRGIPFEYKCRHFRDLELAALTGYLLYHSPRPGDVVVDGGAFHGSFTVLAAMLVGPEGRVIAFEPDPINREVLRENVELNGLDNVTVVPKGLWSRDRRMSFCTYGENYSALSPDSFLCDVNERHVANDVVDMVTLDSELERMKVDRLDFLKMDIEGAEIEAVRGARGVLNRDDVQVAIASYHEVDGRKTCYMLEELLTDIGYWVETNYPPHLTTYARRQ